MRVSEVFGGKTLKAGDLNGREVTVTIDGYAIAKFDKGPKPVLKFVGKEKGLVLNKTNANTITDLFGTDDMDRWVGKRIMLYSARVDFQGQRVDAIRVGGVIEAPRGKAPATSPLRKPAPPAVDEIGEAGDEFHADDSDVPF